MEKMTLDELKKCGLTIHEAGKKIRHEGLLTVEAEFSLESDVALGEIQFEWTTKRKTTVHVHSFKYDAERKVMAFSISTMVPETYRKVMTGYSGVIIANAFPDFCWTLSDGTNNLNKLEVTTPYREGAELGDLTWILPSKFADDLIEALHVMNSAVIEGFMQNSVIYGPFYSSHS